MSTIKCACGGKHCKIQLVIEDARHWMITDKDGDDTLMYFSQETIRQLRTILSMEAESSEARAAALEKERDELRTAYNNVIAMLDEAHTTRDALAAQLATVTAERDALQQIGRDFQVALYERKGVAPLTHREEYAIMNLNKIIGRVISHSERWSFQSDETPLGQALDGMGDEVEP